MIKLYDSYGTQIEAIVSRAFPWKVARKIKNELLNGKMTIQTVGAARTEVDIVCDGDDTLKAKLEDIYCNDEPLRVETASKYYTGLIVDKIDVNRRAPGWYTFSFTLSVNEEGDI